MMTSHQIEEVDDSFFEDLSEEDVALYQAARQSEAEAWAQVQQGRRTLREARERQKEVRLGRKTVRTTLRRFTLTTGPLSDLLTPSQQRAVRR